MKNFLLLWVGFWQMRKKSFIFILLLIFSLLSFTASKLHLNEDINQIFSDKEAVKMLTSSENKKVFINGDGETSRDFCYVENVIQANILAALASNKALNNIYNIALGDQTSLFNLFLMLKHALSLNQIHYEHDPVFQDFRPGDVRHSQADISKAIQMLGYAPSFKLSDGIKNAMPWYVNTLRG